MEDVVGLEDSTHPTHLQSEDSMRGIVTTTCIFSIAVILAASLTASAQRDDSTPPGKDQGRHAFPKQCEGFLKTAHTRLTNVWGSHEPSDAIIASALSADRRYALLAMNPADLEDRVRNPEETEVSLELWDTATSKPIRKFAAKKSTIFSIALSKDGAKALSSGPREIKLWDLAAGKEERAVKHDTPAWNAMALAPEGGRALIGHGNGSLQLWDMEENKFRQLIDDQGVPVVFVGFLPDGKNCVTVWTDGEIRVCSLDNGAEVRSFYALRATCAALSSDAKRIAVGADEGSIQIWELATGTRFQQYTGHTEKVWCVDFSPDGKQLVSCGDDATVRLWNVQTGQEIFKRDVVSVPRVYFAADGKRLVGHSPTGFATLDVANGKEIELIASHRGAVSALAFTADGNRVVSGSEDSTLRLWDAANGKQLRRLVGDADFLAGFSLSADGRLALAGCADHALRLWDTETGKQVRTFTGHDDSILAVALSADARLALSSGLDSMLRLWDAAGGKELRRLIGHDGIATCIALSPDSRMAATGGADRTVRLWNLTGAGEPRALTGHKRDVTCIAFSPDGRNILSGSQDRTLRLWDAATGEEIRALAGHMNWVTAVAFSPDGKQALSASDDMTVKLWDVTTGRELDEIDLSSTPDVPCCVAFAPDGKSFVAGTASWVILRFEISR